MRGSAMRRAELGGDDDRLLRCRGRSRRELGLLRLVKQRRTAHLLRRLRSSKRLQTSGCQYELARAVLAQAFLRGSLKAHSNDCSIVDILAINVRSRRRHEVTDDLVGLHIWGVLQGTQ